MEHISQPHDRFVRSILENPEWARLLLNQLLPVPLPWGPIEEGTLVRASSSFVTPRLTRREADLVYALVPAAARVPTGYVLIEHQSTHDDAMLYRAVEYALHILLQHGRIHGRTGLPPPLHTVVLYHGQRPWTAPLELDSTAAGSHGVIVIIDLARITDEQITHRLGTGLLALFALLLKHGHDTNLAERLPDWNPHFAAAAQGENRTRDGLTACLCYSLEVSNVTEDHLLDLPYARRSIEARDMIKTTGQKLRAEGREQGLKEGIEKGIQKGRREGRQQGLEIGIEKGRREGRQEGRAEMLRILLRRRWGAIPERLQARITRASAEDLESLFERALDAQDPDDLLDD